MGTYLIGKAPLTVVRLNNGSRSNVAAGALVPASIDEDDAERLLDEGYLEEVEVVDEETEVDPEPDPEGEPDPDDEDEDEDEDAPTGPTKISDILATVDGDPEKAKAYLEAEREKGDDARPTLVSKLEEIIAGGNA